MLSNNLYIIWIEIFNKKITIDECLGFQKLKGETLGFQHTLNGNKSFGYSEIVAFHCSSKVISWNVDAKFEDWF